MIRNFAATTALMTALMAGSAHAADCYHKPDDVTETISEADDGSSLVWSYGKKKVTFETGSGGTGVDYRLAFDKKGKGFRYEYKDKNLVFGGVTYVPGCK
jgi:hypothetical protein